MQRAEKIPFQCPSNFKPAAECDGSVTCEPDTEIWLIRTPPDFNPESFNSRRFPLPGYKKQKVKSDGTKKMCHVVASPCSDAPFKAFVCEPEDTGDRLVCAPSFKGTITIAEAHGDPNALHCIPDRPPPTIPQGLKLRYQPFGALPPKDTSGRESLPSGSSKKKKKAKKRKHEDQGH